MDVELEPGGGNESCEFDEPLWLASRNFKWIDWLSAGFYDFSDLKVEN